MADSPNKGKTFTRPVYIVMRVLDSDGNPIELDRSQIEIKAVTRDAGDALGAMDSGEPGLTYKKVDKVT
tara:strand:- start:9676 stop:9882 length:207 start_codon:yes stop_codon:yes gene_type:complete